MKVSTKLSYNLTKPIIKYIYRVNSSCFRNINSQHLGRLLWLSNFTLLKSDISTAKFIMSLPLLPSLRTYRFSLLKIGDDNGVGGSFTFHSHPQTENSSSYPSLYLIGMKFLSHPHFHWVTSILILPSIIN